MTRFIFALVAATFAVGCSGSGDSSSDTAAGSELAGGPSVSGAFTANVTGHELKFKYELTQIDLRAMTVMWNAKLLDNGGLATATDDVNVRGTVTSVARCMGCFTAEMPGNGHPLAVLVVRDWSAASLTYENVTARLSSATSAASSEQDSTGSPNDVGACTQTCSGQVACKSDVKRSQCASGTGLFPVYRCPTSYNFDSGEPCPR